MTEPKANPYNARKDYHEADKLSTATADGMYHQPKQPTDPQTAEVNWEKRYKDLKTYHDNTVTDLRQQVKQQAAVEAAEKMPANPQPQSPPEIPENLKKFQEDFPDLYKNVTDVANQAQRAETEALKKQLETLQEQALEVNRREAITQIAAVHPDVHQIMQSEEFKTWLGTKSKSIQDAMYESTNVADAVDVLNLFKASGVVKSEQPVEANPAAEMISTKTIDHQPQQAKIWKESEIKALKPYQYAELEDEIDQAQIEGRILVGQ